MKRSDLQRLARTRIKEIKANQVFRNYWLIVEDWSEEARYQIATAEDAMELCSAVTDRKNGVLLWLKKYW